MRKMNVYMSPYKTMSYANFTVFYSKNFKLDCFDIPDTEL